MKLNYSLRNEANETPEILIYDQIGEDWWTGDGVTAKRFRQDLAALGSPAEINVRINSEGGSVYEGFAIYNALKEFSGKGSKVVVIIDAAALSAASVIAMAGDTIKAQENATIMIHNAWTIVMGDSVEMRKQADLLEKVNGQIRDVYVARTGNAASEVDQWMKDETWLTAPEAKASKFVDEILPNKAPPAGVSDFTMRTVRNAPKWIRQREAERPRFSAALKFQSTN